ncbi:MAG: hypothetical protein PVH88_22465 [Ignavibacteria bacterium]|jgi:hypothetical protein
MSKLNFCIIFHNLLNNNFKQHEFNHLVKKTSRFALFHANKNIHRIPTSILNDVGVNSIALEAISYLFIKNSSNEYPICVSFKTWKPKIETESEVEYFLNKITFCCIEQYIIKILKENDPIFAKILDSLIYSIKKNNYIKIKLYGQTFVLNKNYDINTTTIITSDFFENLPNELFQNSTYTLEKLFNYLANLNIFSPAIQLNLIVAKIKNSISFQITNHTSEFVHTEIDTKDIVYNSYYTIIDKLNRSYYYKGKIDINEKNIFEKTLFDLANDIMEGNSTYGLFNYISSHSPSLSRNIYQKKYHNILEYLLKLMKCKICDSLKIADIT